MAPTEISTIAENEFGSAFEVQIKSPNSQQKTAAQLRLESYAKMERLPRLKTMEGAPRSGERADKARQQNEQKREAAERVRMGLARSNDAKRQGLAEQLEKAHGLRQGAIHSRKERAAQHYEKVMKAKGGFHSTKIGEVEAKRQNLEEQLEKAHGLREGAIHSRKERAARHCEKVMKKKDDAQQMLAMSAAEAKQRLEEALLQKEALRDQSLAEIMTKATKHNEKVAQKVQEQQIAMESKRQSSKTLPPSERLLDLSMPWQMTILRFRLWRRKDSYTAQWILVSLYFLLALLAVRYSSWLLKVKDALPDSLPPWLELEELLMNVGGSHADTGVDADRECTVEELVKPGPLFVDDRVSTFSVCSPDSSVSVLEATDHALLPDSQADGDATLALPTLVPTSPTNADSAAHPAARDAPPTGPRFAFGVARYIASLHVVLGHLNARGLAPSSVYLCCWGYTWVPWFFMLSGFILCAAEMNKPRQEGPVEYVARRLVTIYPVYAFGLLLSACLTSAGPPCWVLVLQAWLLQAWVPTITEWGLQMQCWFLSCLVVYWAMFPFLFGMVHRMTMPQAILGMVLAVCVPILYLLIPDLFYGNASWYEYHSWGLMRNFEDSLVVMLKFHPMCYVHVFLLGMLLARFRILLHDIAGFKELPVIMDFLAPVGYLGLLLVFNVPMAAPPYAKLSARIFALLPLQAAVVLGLAGVEGLREPFLARFFARLNFLETYSYCVYVMQFICMKLWFGQEYDLSFFIFLIASATFVQVFVQKPSDKLWRLSPGQASWLVPAVMSLLLILLSLRWTGVPDHVLPDKVEGDGYMDIRLPLRLEAQDWSATGGGAFINPSLTLLEDGRLVVAARLHRRSSHLSHFHGGSLLEEIWISKILLGSVAMNNKSWKLLNRSGEMPEILLKLWDGLQMADGKPWIYPNMCYREKWLPQNRTMMRFVVTGPEDPKVFPLTRKGSCAESMAGCWVLRASSDFCHVNQSFCEAKCNSRWCSPHEVQVAFNSYTPKEGKSCDHRSVSQMFLASGIDVERPELVSQGQHLKCGQLDHSEKNWIPFEREGQTYVVYSMIPHLVRELKGTGSCGQQWRSIFPKLEEMQSHLLDAAIRGSASAIYLDAPNATARLPEPHYLALFHAADLKVRRYVHYAYRFAPKPPFQILQVSKPLPLQMLPPMPGAPPFAFASGILLREEQVILTYAAGDRESRALLMSLKQLDKYFE
ncbi:Acyltransferase MdmB [Durusdinium trenchii]|uniref:Acyltransferase MdmB n=1 Tax=Durusdinium trenchii TaxID=1381693 RepID=A0ABP0MEM5_9DINO